jgi:hypothetical protein
MEYIKYPPAAATREELREMSDRVARQMAQQKEQRKQRDGSAEEGAN